MSDFSDRDSVGLSITLHFDLSGTTASAKGIEDIRALLQYQRDYWNQYSKVDPFSSYYGHFQTCVSNFNSYANNFDSWDEPNRGSQFQTLKNQLEARNTPNAYKLLDPDSAEGIWLADLATVNSDQAVGAYNLLFGRSIGNSSENFFGAARAYEFSLQGSDDLQKRRTSEKRSIAQLRKHLDQVAHEFELDSKQHLNAFQNEWSTAQDEFSVWDVETKAKVSSIFEEIENRSEKLEQRYSEQLKIKGPVQYWNQMAAHHRDRGYIWSVLSSVVVFITGFGAYMLIANPPAALSANILDGDAVAVKTLLLFVTFLSFFGFLVRMTAKFAYSAFHLESDAKERENLSMVYLSLVESTEMTNEDRVLILQALFSRSDSGLLKGESGPTLPGLANVVNLK